MIGTVCEDEDYGGRERLGQEQASLTTHQMCIGYLFPLCQHAWWLKYWKFMDGEGSSTYYIHNRVVFFPTKSELIAQAGRGNPDGISLVFLKEGSLRGPPFHSLAEPLVPATKPISTFVTINHWQRPRVSPHKYPKNNFLGLSSAPAFGLEKKMRFFFAVPTGSNNVDAAVKVWTDKMLTSAALLVFLSFFFFRET